MPGPLVQGTFATGSNPVSGNASDVVDVPYGTTSMKLTTTGLDGSNTIKTQKQIAPGRPALAAPVQAAISGSTTGGTIAAGTYYYVVTAINDVGETIASNEQSVVNTGTTSSNTISWGAVTGASGYKIYLGTATGAENAYYAVGAVTSFLDTGAASTAGSPPSTNTTAQQGWVDQTTYNSDQTNTSITVASSEKWRVIGVTQQALKDIRFKLSCES